MLVGKNGNVSRKKHCKWIENLIYGCWFDTILVTLQPIKLRHQLNWNLYITYHIMWRRSQVDVIKRQLMRHARRLQHFYLFSESLTRSFWIILYETMDIDPIAPKNMICQLLLGGINFNTFQYECFTLLPTIYFEIASLLMIRGKKIKKSCSKY